MYCKICNKQFIRGTDNLPYPFDICNKCARENITYTPIEISKDEQFQQYYQIIKLCEAENEKCRKTIEDNNRQIKDIQMQMKELYDKESEN